jgi:hypothetical protein
VRAYAYSRSGDLAAPYSAEIMCEGLPLMDPDEVTRACDELHACVDQGPGDNPGGFARALAEVRRLRAAASWDYPRSILTEVEAQLARWFSSDKWRGTDDGQHAREDLLGHISRLEDAWDRPLA